MPGQTIGVCGGSGWRQPAGSQQMGKRHIGPVYLEPDRTGKAVRSVSGGASGGIIKRQRYVWLTVLSEQCLS